MGPRERIPKVAEGLREIPGVKLTHRAPLRQYTRFGIGGEARMLVDAFTETGLAAAVDALNAGSERFTVIGGGTNLVASDEGFPGAVLRYMGQTIRVDGTMVHAGAGAVLQELTDLTIAHGLRGLETMTGIPGWVGGAIYGNAGAYGHSIHERVESVRYFDGSSIHEMGNAACEFHYRESIFKRRKNWIVLSVTLRMDLADAQELSATAAGILTIRNEKYPPTMRCAGSIFKNLMYDQLPGAVRAELPERVIREGKVPSAYFLEQVGAKGTILGGVRVAAYHANLIYNEGGGTAAQVRALAAELRHRVRERFGIELEEEVQFI